MDVDRVRNELAGTRFADVRWVAETGSTNTDVMELGRQGEPEGIVVVADHQSAGRGRRGRSWQARAGDALMATILLRPPAAVAPLATVAVGVAAADAVGALVDRAPRLKWPNDLVWPGDGTAADRKLAGILAEVDWPAGSPAAGGWSAPGPGERVLVAVGIGLNVTWGGGSAGGAPPPELVDLAVAVDELVGGGGAPGREQLLIGLLRELDRTYGLACGGVGGETELRAAWAGRSATLGRRVRVDLGADDVVGTAVELTPEGHLVVETLEGDRRTVAVGDVVHLRPEPPLA